MHSATHGATRFHYDSGLVGLVVIEVSKDSIGGSDDESIMEVEVPGEDIMALVLDQLRNELIGRLENAEGEELKTLILGIVGYKSARLETEDESDLSPPEMIGHNRCAIQLFHGPGHQSRTSCDVIGPHTMHHVIYGELMQEAEWEGGDAFTGVFDEPSGIHPASS